MDQLTFAGLAYTNKKKTTRRERFLSEMEAVIPWGQFESEIDPYYYDIGNGRRPMELSKMLRIYFMQQWFNLSDPGMEDALYDSESMRRFAGIELGEDAVPDETTILKFRHLLEKHQLTRKLFEKANEYLKSRGLMIREGSIVDATIIDAPTSTKNEQKARDPEMRQVKKGNEWFFGMKVHAGMESSRGLAHTLSFTSANVNDGLMMEALLHGDERVIYGDRAYNSAARRDFYSSQGVDFRVPFQAQRNHPLSVKLRRWNRSVSRVRARGEHGFHVVKCLWGHAKVRYRGIRKNAAQFFTLFALSNLYTVRHKILKLHLQTS